jgi:hypothetical protein
MMMMMMMMMMKRRRRREYGMNADKGFICMSVCLSVCLNPAEMRPILSWRKYVKATTRRRASSLRKQPEYLSLSLSLSRQRRILQVVDFKLVL